MPKILKRLSENSFHGSVLTTMSIKDALLNSNIDEGPIFGGISRVVNYTQDSRPMLFIVVKDDEEVKTLCRLVNEATNGIADKGFMYSLPVSFAEGIK
ncbi:MAG: hypothetical protein PHO86_01430 [Bacilli bacterium]|nr:hypothetical protein [Bacilli bacterium]